MTSDPDRDILKLRRCPACDYDLVGLPANHRCPECGFEYNDRMMLIPAWLRHGGDWPEQTISWLIVPAAAIVLFGVFNVLGVMPRFSLLYAMIVLAGFGIAIPAIVRARRMARGVGDIDLFLDESGVSEHPRRGKKKHHPWQRFRSASIHARRRRSARARPGQTARWTLRLRLRLPARLIRGSPEFVLLCTKRQAALLRNEINRRIVEAHR